jgi:hypothetical protein
LGHGDGQPELTCLMRAGWTRSSMKIDDVVTVEGFLARDTPNVANARVVTGANASYA